jgi:hypothetical protein
MTYRGYEKNEEKAQEGRKIPSVDGRTMADMGLGLLSVLVLALMMGVSAACVESTATGDSTPVQRTPAEPQPDDAALRR